MTGATPSAEHPAPKLKGAIRPFESKIVGMILSVLFAIFVYYFSLWVFEDYLHGDHLFSVMAAVVLMFGGGEEFYRNGNVHDVPVGYAGVALLFKARVRLWPIISSKGYLGEGRHWLIPFIMSVDPVNMQLRDSPTRTNDDLVSRDGDKMIGEFFFIYQVTDPFTWLGAENAEKTLLDIAETEERDAFAQEGAMDLATDSDKKKGVAARMTDELRREAVRFGVGVIETKLKRSQPPQEVLDANAKLQVEEAQLRSEGLEMDGVIARIKQLQELNYSPEKAYEIVAAERGKIVTTRQIYKIEGLEPIVNNPALANLVKLIFGAKEN